MALLYLPQYKKTTLNVAGGINDTQTTGIVLQNVDGVDTSKPGVVAVSYSEPLDTSKVEFITYTSISTSNELQGVQRGQEGFSAKSHSNGASVAFILSKSHINNLNDLVLEEHNQDGTHSDITADTLTVSGASSLSTLTTSGLITADTLKFDGSSVTVEDVKDEDDMTSDSATALATQQSIKAYVDNSAYDPPRVKVTRTTDQTITSGAESTITWDSEVFDTDDMWTSTSSTRITFKTAGLYLVTAAFNFDTNSTGRRYGLLRFNGSVSGAVTEVPAVSGGSTVGQIHQLYTASVNDYVELRVYQNSGGSLAFAKEFDVHLGAFKIA